MQPTLWLGSVNGLHAVVDPAIQIEHSRYVIIYIARHKRVVVYEKAHGRSIWKEFPADAQGEELLRGDYLDWLTEHGDAPIKAAKDLVKVNDVITARRLTNAEFKHQARMKKTSKRYLGFTEPDGLGFIRNAVCRDCHRVLGSEAHLQCNGCHWIVCSDCGACGCTSDPRQAI